MAIKHTELPGRSIMTNAGSGSPDAIPASTWIRVGQENKARGGAEVRCITGTGMSVNLHLQTATDPRSPDASTIAMWAAAVTANGIKDPDSSLVSAALGGKLWYRWVWVVSVTSGTGWASVSGFGETMDT
jgi:hypothetical protein